MAENRSDIRLRSNMCSPSNNDTWNLGRGPAGSSRGGNGDGERGSDGERVGFRMVVPWTRGVFGVNRLEEGTREEGGRNRIDM
jgi:hypothetical protein